MMDFYQEPPPPYTELDPTNRLYHPSSNPNLNGFRVNRKPVPTPGPPAGRPKTSNGQHGPSWQGERRVGVGSTEDGNLMPTFTPGQYARPSATHNGSSRREGHVEADWMNEGNRNPVCASGNRPRTSNGQYGPPREDNRHAEAGCMNDGKWRPVFTGQTRPLTGYNGNLGQDSRLVEADRAIYDSSKPATLQVPSRPTLSVQTAQPADFTDSRPYESPRSTSSSRFNPSASTTTLDTFSAASSIPSSVSSVPSRSSSPSSLLSNPSVQQAYREARHFVGGLVPHPTESTKHFTILRHSHGLVFYQGSNTTLAVSIFADSPLPAERTIWLQNKGWLGTTGMRAKALLGRNGNWLNVTPSTRIPAEQLKPNDERAWQRDISNFQKKANNKTRNHKLRETAIVRIPAEAEDGYFQLVLCISDKVKILCPSPVFRLVSTSTSPHSIKGASLSTLPLEIGAMVAGTYAKKTAGRVIGPVTSVVQNRVQKYMPLAVQKAASKTYDVSGASQLINSRFQQGGEGQFMGVAGDDRDQGPKPPFPIQLYACSEPAFGVFVDLYNAPTINLSEIFEGVLQKLHGYYYGWCRVQQNRQNATNAQDEDTWYQVVLSALPIDVSQSARRNLPRASSRSITLRFIRNFDEQLLLDRWRLEVLVMGFIRPDEPLQRANIEQGLRAGDEAAAEAAMLMDANDMCMSQSILDHPAWSPEVVNQIPRGGDGKGNNGYTGLRGAALRQMEKVPLHKAGIRTPLDYRREQSALTNGLYVQR